MRQKGQALILTLILLAIGATMLVPALGLGATSLRSSQVVTTRTRLLYAADAMQEYVMWKLVYDTSWRSANLGEDGATAYPYINLCGIAVNATVVMKAVPGQGGISLSTDDTIRPTKTVTPSEVPDGSYQTFTYIIRLEQLSNNNSQGLDSVYDILPKALGTGNYLPGSSYIRTDGGEWQPLADPLPENFSGSQNRLRWPYSGNFSSPIRDFAVRQIKEIKFQVQLTLPPSANNGMHFNHIVIKAGNITSFSGPQAPIKIGFGVNRDQDGMLSVSKVANPNIILPGLIQDIAYSISVSNNDTANHNIDTITDYLPPDFYYAGNTTGGFGSGAPTTLNVTFPGNITRQRLVWVPPSAGNQNRVDQGTTKTLTFLARTTKDVSGSYYNEVFVYSSDFTISPSSPYFGLGLTNADFQQGYSWNSGTVIVPAYDSSTNASGVVVNANLALRGLSSILINSYNIR